MADELLDISVATDSTAISKDNAVITKMEKTEKVTIRRAANHNEVSIMESTWVQIKRKVNLISLQTRVDISSILIGAMIPYAINIINDYINKTSPNYFPFFVCCILLLICKCAVKHIPYLGEDITSTNKIHLEDLKNYIEQVDSTLNTSESTCKK